MASSDKQKQEQYAKDATQYQILAWYIELAKSLQRAGMAVKKSFRAGSLPELWEVLSFAADELDAIEEGIDLFPWSLFTSSDIQRVMPYEKALEEAKGRAGRKRIATDIDERKKNALIFRLGTADRYWALREQFNSLRLIMFSNDWFAKGFTGHRESDLRFD